MAALLKKKAKRFSLTVMAPKIQAILHTLHPSLHFRLPQFKQSHLRLVMGATLESLPKSKKPTATAAGHLVHSG